VKYILAPYVNAEKAKLHLPPRQKALWQFDVWSVHCSKEFHGWMDEYHPRIVLDFVVVVHQPAMSVFSDFSSYR
jgi:hypothetical protein